MLLVKMINAFQGAKIGIIFYMAMIFCQKKARR